MRERGLGLCDLCLKVSLNQSGICPACVCSFPFFRNQGACLLQELETWNMCAPPVLIFFSILLC